MEGRASISSEILASYAADAAREVPGVSGLVERPLPRARGVRVTDEAGRIRVEIHVRVDWGASIPSVGKQIRLRVREYLLRMADLEVEDVVVVVNEVSPP